MSKGTSPKKYTAEFKLNTVLEGYATGNFSETAGKHGIHMTQLNNWKRQLLEHGKAAFASNTARKTDDQRKIEQLEKTLGRLAFENYILKKTEELLS